MDRPERNMSLELFKKIMDESYPQVSFCWLHLFGDTLLNKDLPQMIQYAGKRSIRCGISTNRIGLTEETGRRLADAGLDIIIISLDAVESETYNLVRPGEKFENIVKNTEAFLNLPEKKRIWEMIIQIIQDNENRNKVDRFIEKWKGPDRKVHIKNEDTWAGHFASGEEDADPVKRVPCRKT